MYGKDSETELLIEEMWVNESDKFLHFHNYSFLNLKWTLN